MTSEIPSPASPRPEPRQLARVTLAQAAADAVREMIMLGELPVGSRIRQRELAAQLRVSRTPMREALSKLASEGLIRTDPSGQAIVCRPSVEELEELYEIRQLLEGQAAAHAAEHRRPEDVERLRRIVASLDHAPSADAWVRLNAEFHTALYRLAQRAELVRLIDSLRIRTEVYVRILVETGSSDEAQQDHRDIVAALDAGDADKIRSLVHKHLRHTRDRVAAVIRSQGGS
ncbi:MAG TPA: GntR family transcriptional regulator [Solirubrobacteraceae bacterium]|nr:GntR family transcriptional regulator [Solirubrobacteraceae bacterium]